MICQTKTIQISTYIITINNLLGDLLIRQTFFCQMLEESVYQTCPYQTFPLYSIWFVDIIITGTMGIIGLWHGNKLIKNNGEKFWEILEGIIGKTKSIIGSD